jgi:hypothetical protein
MNTVAIITPLNNIVFGDLAKALTMSFMELGWQSMWLGDKDQIREYAKSLDLAIVLTPFDYKDIHKILPRTKRVYYQLETLPWPTKIHLTRRKYWQWEERLEMMNNYDYVFEHDKGNITNQYRWYDIRRPVLYAPIGYSSAFELPKKVSQRNIALFIGSDSDHPKYVHRNRTIRHLKGKLRRRFAIATDRWGDKARQAAKNAAVNLNIHQNNIPSFEAMRIVSLLMSNRCFVMTEPCEDMGPFEHLEHLVIIKHQDMAPEISDYLNKPWERERIADNAYNYIRKHYTMTQNLKEALKQL